ncbi:hypothetical protein WG908_02875 [Sphingobium sp. AN641]|uniref:hypothetical protein n=1 Tax=Sphingobium sp. AN641 TaxID=3133443 RepID=UPI0030C1CF14
MAQRDKPAAQVKPKSELMTVDPAQPAMPETVSYSLYGNGHTGLEYITRPTPSAKLAVTFANYDSLDIHAPGYAEAFLLQRGYDVLALKCNINNWYQDLSRETLKDIVSKRLPAYETILTYGSDMGGYAAMYFADAIGAQTVIALSPQLSNDPEIVPFDVRWAADAARMTFHHEPLTDILRHSGATHYVVYDPYSPDAGHAHMMLEASNYVMLVPAPYTGHPAGVVLEQMNLLPALFDSLARGDVPNLRAQMRKRRDRSSGYLFNLAKACAARGHNGAADTLFKQVYERRDFAQAQVEYSRFLLRQGKADEALALLNKTWPVIAHDVTMIAFRAHLQYLTGQFDDALASFDTAIAREPDILAFYKDERTLLRDLIQQQKHELRLTTSALDRTRAELTLKRGADPDKLDARALVMLIGLPLLVLTLLIVIVISFRLT